MLFGRTCTCRADDEESADDNKAIFTSREKGPIKIWQGPCGPTSQDLIKKDMLASAVGKLQNTFIPFTTNKKILRRSFRARIIRMHQGKGPGNLELKASASAEERGDIPGSTLTFFQRCAGRGGIRGIDCFAAPLYQSPTIRKSYK